MLLFASKRARVRYSILYWIASECSHFIQIACVSEVETEIRIWTSEKN